MKAPCPELESFRRRARPGKYPHGGLQVYLGWGPARALTGERSLLVLSCPRFSVWMRGESLEGGAASWRKVWSRRSAPSVRNLSTMRRVSLLVVGDITSDVSNVSPAARNWNPLRCCATRSDNFHTLCEVLRFEKSAQDGLYCRTCHLKVEPKESPKIFANTSVIKPQDGKVRQNPCKCQG